MHPINVQLTQKLQRISIRVYHCWLTSVEMDRFAHQELVDMHMGQLVKKTPDLGMLMKTKNSTETFCGIKYLHMWIAICTNIVHCAATCRMRRKDEWHRLSTSKNNSYSTQAIAQHLGGLQWTVCRMLQDERVHLFHLQKVQLLQPNDFPKRVECTQWIMKTVPWMPVF